MKKDFSKYLLKKENVLSNINNDYCNNRRQPSLELLNKIAQILDVNNKDLIISSKDN